MLKRNFLKNEQMENYSHILSNKEDHSTKQFFK